MIDNPSNQSPNPGEGDLNSSPNRTAWQNAQLSASTRDILARDASVFMHQSVSTPCLSVTKEVGGIYVLDNDGNRYMDFHGNNVHHIGYSHPRLVAALKEQLDLLSFSPRRFACQEAIDLGDLLTQIAPGDLSRLLLAPSGNDALEMALSYARAFTGRFKTISFWDAYHGAGFGARSVGGEAMFRSGPIGPLLPGTEHIPPFGDYRNAWGVESGSGDLCFRTLRYVLEREGDVAAVVAEPTRAVPYIPPPGFWKSVKEACEEFGALLIFDEIPTGLGKTGKMFSSQWEDVVPDIMVVGKSLGGGIVPVAAMLASEKLNILQDYSYGHYTHEKNPFLCRAAIETIRIIQEERLVENAHSVGSVALERLRQMQDKYEEIGDVRGRGCLFGAELVKSRDSREPHPDLADLMLYECLSNGLSFKTTMGNVLTFTPPLIVNYDQMNQAMDIVEKAISVCLEKLSGAR